jgi:hypothetical protein
MIEKHVQIRGVSMKRLIGLVGIAAVTAFLVAGCNDTESNGPLQGVAPDFSLKDVNPNSATHDSTISPRDYLGKVSAWYFGHAT